MKRLLDQLMMSRKKHSSLFVLEHIEGKDMMVLYEKEGVES